MKVITIREPYATLIKEGYKKIETRSWKTNYRGKIYIHAGLNKTMPDNITKQNLEGLTKGLEFSYGCIICEAELIDCIYMTNEYIEEIKKDNYQEYLVGEYQVGRYAWVLDNVKVLDKKIDVKGKLGLWNFES